MFGLSSKRAAAAAAAASRPSDPSQPRRNSISSTAAAAGSRRPRLERRNAVRNIDYDAAASSWASSASSSDDSPGLRATRSLDIPYSDQTSFRIEGLDGEVDELCRSLGLSGPEDFGISAAAWEARKARTVADLLPPSRLLNSQSAPETLLDPPTHVLDSSEDPRRSPDRPTTDDRADPPVADASPPPKSSGGSPDGGGIKGACPPVLIPPPPRSKQALPPPPLKQILPSPPSNQTLTLPPPPSMVLPALEEMGSTWDLLRSFAPDGDDEDYNGGGVLGEEGEGDFEDVSAVEVRIDETVGDMMASSSFSTTNDDDSSITTTERSMSFPDGRFRRSIHTWKQGGLIGSGSFGTVYEGVNNDDGFCFAVKEVSFLDQGSDAQQCIVQLEQVIAHLTQFEHENIVQYFGTDKEEAKLYIFHELASQGSLASLYQKYHLRDSQVSAYTRQILNGLNYLHDRNVVHRDIKCANILVGATGSVKLADFGLAKEIPKLNVLKSCKGSVYWMAPEVVNPKRSYGPQADIWSLGCTVLEMLTRQVPYPNLEWTQAFFKIGHGEKPPIPKTLSNDARDFIQKCVQVNPDDRPTATELLEHPFIKRPMSASTSPDVSVRNGRRQSD